MSPVFILSRLCLKRRFQFFGMTVPLPRSAFSTCSTVVSSMTLRRPTRSAFSVGTLTVMSLWRIWIVRYSRSSPEHFPLVLLDHGARPRDADTRPYRRPCTSPTSPFRVISPSRRQVDTAGERDPGYQKLLEKATFSALLLEKALLRATTRPGSWPSREPQTPPDGGCRPARSVDLRPRFRACGDEHGARGRAWRTPEPGARPGPPAAAGR